MLDIGWVWGIGYVIGGIVMDLGEVAAGITGLVTGEFPIIGIKTTKGIEVTAFRGGGNREVLEVIEVEGNRIGGFDGEGSSSYSNRGVHGEPSEGSNGEGRDY